ncbi:UNVERIFIED_CONTAM: Cytochrome c oxidase subunit [Sesamum calycinum]|uniref:Cytochrome c oxidase subunit n=1 Tax=Sesamum calycinum TaxID=2727403 RepID=A0AAW2JZS5_9LAMI
MSSRWSVVFSFASLLTKSVPRPVRVAGEQDGSAPEGEAVRKGTRRRRVSQDAIWAAADAEQNEWPPFVQGVAVNRSPFRDLRTKGKRSPEYSTRSPFLAAMGSTCEQGGQKRRAVAVEALATAKRLPSAKERPPPLEPFKSEYALRYMLDCLLNGTPTMFISGFIVKPRSSKNGVSKTQSAGNQRHKSSLVGTSETTCATTYPKSFCEWLAGIIDGDGSLQVSKQGYASLEITMGLEDLPLLRYIQHMLGGSIKMRSGAKAYRYRLHNQLGFFDADGTIGIAMKNRLPQLSIRVTNKLLQDVESYKDFTIGAFGYATSHSRLSRCLRWMECLSSFGSYISVVGICRSSVVTITSSSGKNKRCAPSPWAVEQNPTTPEWMVQSPPAFHTFGELPAIKETKSYVK